MKYWHLLTIYDIKSEKSFFLPKNKKMPLSKYAEGQKWANSLLDVFRTFW